jgi:hypothetical protein
MYNAMSNSACLSQEKWWRPFRRSRMAKETYKLCPIQHLYLTWKMMKPPSEEVEWWKKDISRKLHCCFFKNNCFLSLAREAKGAGRGIQEFENNSL